MKISSRVKGGIYEVSSGYNPQMGGYTTLMSDIPELCEMRLQYSKANVNRTGGLKWKRSK